MAAVAERDVSNATYLVGDALAILATLPADSFDAMLCDPPYGIAFMGKEWDRGVPSADVWREALRVLKPGAYALVACGTRTQHRMATALEDAGFEARDLIAWVYGSGFPKSHDVSKAIDKAAGADGDRPVVGPNPAARPGNAGTGVAGETATTSTGWRKPERPPKTGAATADAERWQGYGTALKPAMELWTLVRKPTDGTVAANALKHGVGGLNIDGCRVATDDPPQPFGTPTKSVGGLMNKTGDLREKPYEAHTLGRWPANLIHDGSDEATAGFPDTVSGVMRGGTIRTRDGGYHGGFGPVATAHDTPGDRGSAARYFYAAKASRAEREAGVGANPHPTVKPIALTTYLATLLLPPERVDGAPRRILTPFSGVGSEVIGALRAGWDEAVGIELDTGYAEIARARVAHWVGADLAPDEPDEAPMALRQAPLFSPT